MCDYWYANVNFRAGKSGNVKSYFGINKSIIHGIEVVQPGA